MLLFVINSHWREMAALALSVLRGIVENDLKMEKVYVYLPQVNCAFSNIFASILSRSPISRQRLNIDIHVNDGTFTPGCVKSLQMCAKLILALYFLLGLADF